MIFLLGVSAVNVTVEISDDRLINIGRIIISLLYVIVSGKMHQSFMHNGANYIITVLFGIIDCVVILFILNHTIKITIPTIIRIGIFVLIWCIITLNDLPAVNSEILHPITAALISGTALSRIINAEDNINGGLLLSGMAGVMLFDTIF